MTGLGLDASSQTIEYAPGLANQTAQINPSNLWYFGGTEVTQMIGYQGAAYLGISYANDVPVTEGTGGAQIIVFSAGSAPAQIEAQFSVNDIYVSAMLGENFTLPASESLAVCSTYNTLGYNSLYIRDAFASAWQFAQVVSKNSSGSNAQIRSLFMYTDTATNISRVFIGDTPNGIYSLQYSANNPGNLSNAVLELNTTGFTPITGATDVRISSFGILNNILYATIGNELYQRNNGASPSWTLVFTDTGYASSQTGLRGLTTSPNGQVFFAGREGTNAAILQLNPGSPWTATPVYTSVNVATALTSAYGETVTLGYGIPLYTSMDNYTSNNGNSALAGGWSTFITSPTSNTPVVFNTPSSANVYSLPLFLIFNNFGTNEWHLNQLQQSTPQAMVAARIMAFPFASGTDIWFAGFDCFGNNNHNSAYAIKVSANTLGNQRLA